ncbi:alpha tubulin, partial [Mycena olivaceomarginata]
YGKKSKFEYCVVPRSQLSSSVHCDCSFMVDKRRSTTFARKLGVVVAQLLQPEQTDRQVVSSITASLRFDGSLNVDLNDFQTNLVP